MNNGNHIEHKGRGEKFCYFSGPGYIALIVGFVEVIEKVCWLHNHPVSNIHPPIS